MGARIGRSQAAPTLPECRPASSRSLRGRAAPGSRAGRRRPPAGGSRTSGAGRADARRRAPARGRACRAQIRRRRRTSDVHSRRPDFDRNSARVAGADASSAGRPALQVALERAQRVLADRHEPRLAALALDAHRLGVEVDRRRRRGRRAPRRAARRRRRARTARGRAARAASSAGIRSSSAATSAASQHARQALGALGRAQQVGRVLRALAVLASARGTAPRSAASLRATVVGAAPRSRQPGGVAAQRPQVDRRRRQPRALAQARELAASIA